MNIPGFTAEASLDKTSKRYQMVGVSDVLVDGREVIPQLRQPYCRTIGGVTCCWTPWYGWQCVERHFIE
ncbi:MAG TPA: hypothetical protein VGX92_21085 [Pyrinomonadaceae bacterium]|nr:hypothetical protein [Pyrinomonadaceae bacterium]